jgi:hypothetical protein
MRHGLLGQLLRRQRGPDILFLPFTVVRAPL